jgi:hypothetical protein
MTYSGAQMFLGTLGRVFAHAFLIVTLLQSLLLYSIGSALASRGCGLLARRQGPDHEHRVVRGREHHDQSRSCHLPRRASSPEAAAVCAVCAEQDRKRAREQRAGAAVWRRWDRVGRAQPRQPPDRDVATPRCDDSVEPHGRKSAAWALRVHSPLMLARRT